MPWLTPVDDPARADQDGDAVRPATPLTIRISAGAGTGRTRLSAFDAALRDAGVADFNLVRLSSVIPPGSRVLQVESSEQPRGGIGDRLYCVYAVAYASTPAEQAWAGLAWSSNRDTGSGLFVEHEGASPATVEHDLRVSLEDLGTGRGGGYAPDGLLMSSAECVDHPVCAVVIATYRTVSWSHHVG